MFAQRVDNALVSLFPLARALQLPRIKRLSEGDPDFPETRQDSADWQGLVCSRDERRFTGTGKRASTIPIPGLNG